MVNLKEIRTERPHLFAPNINVAMKVEVLGDPSDKQMTAAIHKAVMANESLNSKIVITKEGTACYERIQQPIYSLEVTDKDYLTVVKEQAQKMFRFDQGELAKFFILRKTDQLELLIIIHHLAGDGISLTYLFEDIMSALSGNEIAFKPLELVSVKDFPQGSEMPWMKKAYLNSLNRKWSKDKRAFFFQDYFKVFLNYWKTTKVEVLSQTFSLEEVHKLHEYAKKIGITINSVLTTAFLKAYEKKSYTGLSVSIRKNAYKGMANQVSGTAITYQYDESLSFDENAKIVHQSIYACLNNDKRKYFVLRFVDMMDGALLDSACMVRYTDYQNKTAKRLCHLMSYDGNPRDIGITNLTKVDIPLEYGKYHIRNMVFIPPIIPYGHRIFGIATLGDMMCITFSVIINDKLEDEKIFFSKAIQNIKNVM